MRRAKNKLKALENSLWKSLFPLVIKGKYLEFPSSLPGHYNLKTEDGFCKLVVKNKTFFRQEAKNISKIKESYPEIGKIIPNYSHKELLNGLFLMRKTQLLSPIEKEEEAYQTAGEFLSLFRKYGTQKATKLDDLHHLKEGLEVIRCFASLF
jgi:hypothetical protein